MFNAIARLEIRQQLRSPVLWLALFFFGAYASWGVNDISRLLAKPGVYINASMLTIQLIALIGFANTVFIPLFMAQAMLRDIEHRTAPLIFVTPVSRFDYVFGRFLAGYLVALAVPVLCALVVMASPLAPWVDAQRIGPTPWGAFAWALCILVAPNTLLLCALIAALASWTHSLKSLYVGLISFVAMRLVITKLSDGWLSVLLDPAAAKPVIDAILQGSASIVNQGVPPLKGALLLNRAIWLSISAILMATTYWTFRRTLQAERQLKQRADPADAGVKRKTWSAPQRVDRWTWLSQIRSLCRLDLEDLFRSPSFVIVVTICVLSTGFHLGFSSNANGVLPTAAITLGAVQTALRWPLYIAVCFYTGELTWRARIHQFAAASDTYPVANTVQWLSRWFALAVVISITALSCTLMGLGWQLTHGAPGAAVGEYVAATCLTILPYLYFAVLALFLQAVTHQRYAGYALSGLCLLLFEVVLPQRGWDNPLWIYGHFPAQNLSDLTGFFPTWPVTLAYVVYWAAGAAVLFILTSLCAVRGEDSALGLRWKRLQQRLGRQQWWAGATAILVWVGTGLLIWHNQVTAPFTHDEAAAYETLYATYAARSQPRIASVALEVDFYPGKHRVHVEGTYQLRNTTTAPIQDLIVQYGRTFTLDSITLSSHQTLVADQRLGFFVYRLREPLAPGQMLSFGFVLSREDPRLPTWRSQVLVPDNGTFFTNAEFPHIGYQPRLELTDATRRHKFGLQAKSGTFTGEANNLLGNDADWLTYRATLSTVKGQVALTAGRLESTWAQGDRVFYRYASDAPMLNMMPFLSGAYASKATQSANARVVVYHMPGHAKNVDSILKAAKDSLSTYGDLFSPYPHQQLSLIEVAGHTSAQSFPGVIVLPEVETFFAQAPAAKGLDTPYLVVAHEVAHQWWAHQVIAADAPGFDVLTESLAQYSALLALEKSHSPETVDATCRDMLRSYTLGQGANVDPELPLDQTVGQPYVAYNKGPLALHALESRVGREGFTRTMQQFLQEARFQANPYPTASKLVQRFLSTWQDVSSQGFLKELFQQVVVYDLRVMAARSVLRPGGQYQVTLDLQGRRIERDRTGNERETSIAVPVDVTIFSEATANQPGKELAHEQVQLAPMGHSTHVTISTVAKPAMVVLDQNHLLLNKSLSDASAPIGGS